LRCIQLTLMVKQARGFGLELADQREVAFGVSICHECLLRVVKDSTDSQLASATRGSANGQCG